MTKAKQGKAVAVQQAYETAKRRQQDVYKLTQKHWKKIDAL
jgi:hypothetical protein